MRDERLTLRILVLAVLLPSAAAVCVIALVLAGTLHPHIAQMLAAGGAILIVAVLSAALSAFSPKFRPTPLLTPLFAGIFAAVLATTAIYAVHTQVTPKRTAVAAVQPKAPARPVKTAPVIEPAPVEPDLAAPPSMQPVFDDSAAMMPAKAQDQVAAKVQPLPANAEDRAAMGGPFVDVANAVVTPASAAEAPAAARAQNKPTVAVARIPVPATAPAAETAPDPNAPLNLAARFDPTGPTVPPAEGPPMMLDEPGATAAHAAAIPPLPRIRPCGAAGQACP